MRNSLNRTVLRSGAIAFASLAVTLGLAAGPGPVAVATTLPDVAPGFRLPTLDGREVSLADLKGRPAVLVFWSSWCIACREEVPALNAFHRKHPTVRVVGIDMQESDARVQAVARRLGIAYPVALDRDGKVASAFGVVGAPTTVLLDRKGVIRFKDNRLPDDGALATDL